MSAGRPVAKALATLLAVSALSALSAGLAGAQIDSFYVDLERDARIAAERGDAPLAARLYRIACFGMLDEPARLAACTVRLALAQGAARDREGFGETFSRLATVEERFQGLTLAELTAGERAELARIAAALLPAETLDAIPAVAALARASKPTASQPAAATRGRGRREKASAPRDEVVAMTPPAAPAPASELEENLAADPETEAAPVAAPAGPLPISTAEQEQVAAARTMLAGRPDRAALEATIGSLREVADRHPEAPGVARLVGDLAYRAAHWELCADYYGRAGDPGPELPLDRFYMAVCLYETGRREAAAALLAPSAERLKRSPFVDSYLGKILPPSGVP